MLPDSPTLTAMIEAASPSPWRLVAIPDHCPDTADGNPTVPVVEDADGKWICNGEKYYPVRVSVPNAALIALAPDLAAEVVRLRAEAATIRHFFANLDERMAESRRCADAEREAAELKSRIDGALQILDDPDDLEEGICRAADVLWGEK